MGGAFGKKDALEEAFVREREKQFLAFFESLFF